MQVAAVRKLGEDGDIVGLGCRLRGVRMFSAGMFSARLLGFGCFGCVGVAGRGDPTQVTWKPLHEVLPDYWMTVFPGEISSRWQ